MTVKQPNKEKYGVHVNITYNSISNHLINISTLAKMFAKREGNEVVNGYFVKSHCVIL